MKLSLRSKLSLVQLLQILATQDLSVLVEKHFGIYDPDQALNDLRNLVMAAKDEQIITLCDELVKTGGTFRLNLSPRWAYDQRWSDFCQSMLLDGFLIKDQGPSKERQIIPIDPSIGDDANLEDDLTKELRATNLNGIDEILQSLSRSSEDFRKTSPDYNGCLNNARVALQTLATTIAKNRIQFYPGNFDESSWGQVVAYLRVSGFITKQEEEGLTGVFSFVSPGSHTPMGMSDSEVTRLGRSFILGMCYFLAKQYNAARR